MTDFEFEFRHKAMTKSQIMWQTALFSLSLLILLSSTNGNANPMSMLIIASTCVVLIFIIYRLVKYHSIYIKIDNFAMEIDKKYLWGQSKNCLNFSELNNLIVLNETNSSNIIVEYNGKDGKKEQLIIMPTPNKIKQDIDYKNAMRCIEVLRSKVLQK